MQTAATCSVRPSDHISQFVSLMVNDIQKSLNFTYAFKCSKIVSWFPGPDLAGGRPGPSQGRNYGLKSGGPSSRHLRRDAEGVKRDEQWELGDIPPGGLRGLGQSSNYIIIYEGEGK